MSIELTFPDGSVHSFADGATGFEVAASIGSRLAKAAVAVRVDGDWFDVSRPLPAGGTFEVVTETSEDGRHVLRHSAAHVMAQAVLDLYEGAAFAIGPAIQDGFYYDFDIGRPFTPDDIEAIERRMAEIIAEDQPFERDELSIAEALEVFSDQKFKKEIIEAVDESEVKGGDVISIYRNHDFVDLCRGPHLPSTGRLKAVKLLRSAGAYWRGDENRDQLQRIYGTAWESKQALADYLHRLEEAERRDHRRLGAELDLFSFPRELGSGLAVWHPKGGLMRKVIEDYSRRTHLEYGYDYVTTPHVAKAHLWETSGHVDFYADGMYPEMELDDGDAYYVKPMNCPFHILIYKAHARSYRELPMRLYELGTVYRYERSGVIHGLMRARGFTQDDSHIFCKRDQLVGELQGLLDFTLMVLRDFGFEEFEADLSTRDPEKWMGDLDLWDEATDALRQSLDKAGIEFEIAEGEAAFYGPKVDVHVRDAIGRRWQLSTIQVDFAQPDNFELEFNNTNNERERPVMIHRALFGSVERFFGILIEHYAGVFPTWLAPVQAAVIPVADRHIEYAEEVVAELRKAGLRVHVDNSDATVGDKIRKSMNQKYPYTLVVGDQDVEDGTVGARRFGEERERRGLPLADLKSELIDAAEPPR